MLILALDTTTRAGSCALWRDGAVLEERVGAADRTHAERLPGELDDLLAAHGATPADVDLFAVASGPGSFTGLRVGIATIQTLALVHNRSVVPVTALEALGESGARIASARTPAESAAPVLVGAWMDAYRGEVFGALYRVIGPRASANGGSTLALATERLFVLEELAPPSVAAPAALADAWSGPTGAALAMARLPDDEPAGGSAVPPPGFEPRFPAPFVIIGDGVPSSEPVLRARWPDAHLVDGVPLAAIIAQIAAVSPDRAVRPHAIVPVYVRRPDAERARDRTRAAADPAP